MIHKVNGKGSLPLKSLPHARHQHCLAVVNFDTLFVSGGKPSTFSRDTLIYKEEENA